MSVAAPASFAGAIVATLAAGLGYLGGSRSAWSAEVPEPAPAPAPIAVAPCACECSFKLELPAIAVPVELLWALSGALLATAALLAWRRWASPGARRPAALALAR